MSETPRPTPTPTSTPSPAPTPTPNPTPTPASVSGEVPIKAWRASLAEAKEASAAQRHEHLNSLLGDLDAQVGSL